MRDELLSAIGVAGQAVTAMGLGVAGQAIWELWCSREQTVRDLMGQQMVIGTVRSGKSAYATHRLLRLIRQGWGAIHICPQGTGEQLLDKIPRHRIQDVLLVAPYEERVIGLNLLQRFSNAPEERYWIAANFVASLAQQYKRSWGDNIEAAIRYATLAVLEAQERSNEFRDATALDVWRCLADEDYRQRVLRHVDNFVVQEFLESMERIKSRQAGMQRAQLKLQNPFADEYMQAFFGQPRGVDLATAMDEGKIIIFGLDQQKLGGNALWVGHAIINAVFQAAARRQNDEASPVVCMIDECHYWATNEHLPLMIEMMGKKNISMLLCLQHLHQVPERMQAALWLCGSQFIFRPSAKDLPHIAQQLKPYIDLEELRDLPQYHCVHRFLRHGKLVKPYIARTPAPARGYGEEYREMVRSLAMASGRPRKEIIQVIRERMAPVEDSLPIGRAEQYEIDSEGSGDY